MGNTLELVITANGTAAVTAVNGVSTSIEKLEENARRNFASLKDHWVAFSAAAAAAMIAVGKAWNLAEQAAAYQEQKASLNALATAYNTTANTIIADIDRASQGLIGWADAARVAASGLARGLNPDQIVRLAEAAETLSNVTGEKAASAFENLTGAIALGRERALEASVGIIDLAAKYGDAANKMSDAEKAQARYTMVMEKVQAIQTRLGESTDSTADKMERFTVTIKNWSLIAGDICIRAAMLVIGTLREWASWAVYAAAGTMKLAAASGWLTDKAGLTKGAYERWNATATDLLATARNLHDTAIADIASAFATSAEKAGAAVGGLGDAGSRSGVTQLADELKKAQQALSDIAFSAALADPSLSDLDKTFMQLDRTAEKFKETYAAFPELFGQVDAAIAKAKGFATLDMELKQAAEHAEKFRRAYFAREEFERELTDKTASEIDRRITEEDRWVEHMRLKALEFVTTVEEFDAIDLRITEEAANAKAAIWSAYYDNLMKREEELLARKEESMNSIMVQDIAQGTQGMPGQQDLLGLASIGMGEDIYTNALNRLDEYYAQRLAMTTNHLEQVYILTEWEAQQEEVLNQQKLQMASNTFGMMAAAAQSFYQMSGNQSKVAFVAYKAFAIAQTTIDTYKAAVAAYAAMAGIPVVGPALGAAAAAAAIAFGLAQIQAIMAAQPGSKPTNNTVPRSVSAYPSTRTDESASSTKNTKTESSPVYNVYIYGSVVDYDKFAREVIPAIAKAQEDRVR